MKGIELSRNFYNEFGKQMIADEFPHLENRIAVGIAGKGSECFGFDDEISLDHDFGAGFSMWITEQDDFDFGFKLSRAYAKLPKEFQGVKIQATSYLGQSKFGVQKISDFFKNTVGFEKIPTQWQEWFYVPDYAYSESVNGEVFKDVLGEFSSVRQQIKEDFPRDVKLKKLSAHLALCAQSGQYNFPRMIKHGELVGAQLAVAEFVNQALYVIFSLNNEFLPYYKWRLKALSKLLKLRDMSIEFEFLLTKDNSEKNENIKIQTIEKVTSMIIEELKNQNLSQSASDYLENHAISVATQIKSREIKSLHLMECGE